MDPFECDVCKRLRDFKHKFKLVSATSCMNRCGGQDPGVGHHHHVLIEEQPVVVAGAKMSKEEMEEFRQWKKERAR